MLSHFSPPTNIPSLSNINLRMRQMNTLKHQCNTWAPPGRVSGLVEGWWC